MKFLLNLMALMPLSVASATTSTTSASLNYIDRQDTIGSCKALLSGIHFKAEEESGFGSQTDILFAGDNNFHIVYSNTELFMRYSLTTNVEILPTVAWKNIWRGLKEKKEHKYDAFSVSSISSQHGMGYVGTRVEYKYSEFLCAFIHPQIFYEAVAICFVNNKAKFHGAHSQKSNGWALTVGLNGKIRGNFSYALQQKIERSFDISTRDFVSSFKLSYGF